MLQLPLRGKRKQVNISLYHNPYQPLSAALIKSLFDALFSPLYSEYESSQGPDKKRTVYQMALSKKSFSPLLSYSKRVFFNLEGWWSSVKPSCLHFFLYFKLPLSTLHFCPCSVFVLDKLDEILAAAQHTITSDNQGQRGHGGKRDRSKSIVPNVSNEVLLAIEVESEHNLGSAQSAKYS